MSYSFKSEHRHLDEYGIIKPLTEYKRKLSRKPTKTEKRFKRYLEVNNVPRVRFQEIVGWYIVDFLFTEFGVVVELDGSSHKDKEEYDKSRDRWIETCGFTVLRFSNEYAWNNPAKIMEEIRKHKPKLPVNHVMARAITSRRATNEIRLSKHGKKRADGLIKDLKSFSVKQLEFPDILVLDKIVDVPFSKKPNCPHCGQRLNVHLHRCQHCCSIIRVGWTDVYAPHQKLKRVKPEPPDSDGFVVKIKKGRVIMSDGERRRPRCPRCSTAVASTWKLCQGCQAVIEWEK